MKKVLLTAAAVVLLASAVVIGWNQFSETATAQRAAIVRFEYAVINGSYLPYPPDNASSVFAAVNVCYLQANGCQNEEIKTEVNISKFIQDERLENSAGVRRLAQSRAYQTSFSRTLAKLGGEGWEIVSAPDIEFDLYYTNQQGIQTVKEGAKSERQHIWFKRVRQ